MTELFLDRFDAGRKLASTLSDYQKRKTRIFAIPRGGVPVGLEVARWLNAPLELVIPRKLPIPWNPEAGFGAITANDTIVLNEGIVRELGLSPEQIDSVSAKAKAEIEHQAATFEVNASPRFISGQSAIIVDDGLASGYTMLAAIVSLRKAHPEELVVAVPVSSEHAARLVEPAVDKFIPLIVSKQLPFSVASFYVKWYDVSDEEVKQLLEQRKAEIAAQRQSK